MQANTIFNEVKYFAVLAALFTGLMMLFPTYPETDFWGKFLNNFLIMVGFYLATRIAMNLGGRKR